MKFLILRAADETAFTYCIYVIYNHLKRSIALFVFSPFGDFILVESLELIIKRKASGIEYPNGAVVIPA